MALQTSGTISISQINAEVTQINSTSLRALSAAAGKGTPDAMSEFYGYSAASLRVYYNSTSPYLRASNVGGQTGNGSSNAITFTMRTYGDGNSAYSNWESVNWPTSPQRIFFRVFGGTTFNLIRIYQSAGSNGPWTFRGQGNGTSTDITAQAAVSVLNGRYWLLEIDKQNGSENTLYSTNGLLWFQPN